MSCKHSHDTNHVLVIVPTLGERLDLLKRNLVSIQNSGVKVCIVLVDSSGSDDVESLGLEVQLVRSQPAGLSSAINLGLRKANCGSKYLAWLGDDDFYEARGLLALVDALSSCDGASFAFGSCRYVDSDSRTIRILRPNLMSVFATKFINTRIAQPATLINRERLPDGDLVREDLKYTMDLELWIRLIALGRPVKVKDICASYTWHSGSLSSRGQIAAVSEALRVRRGYFGFIRTLGAWIISVAAVARLTYGNSALDRDLKSRHGNGNH